VTHKIASLLGKAYLSSDDQDTPRSYLAKIHQRHPAVFTAATNELVEEDEDVKPKIEQLLMEIAVVSLHTVRVELECSNCKRRSSLQMEKERTKLWPPHTRMHKSEL
jgi:hypothetical protein